MTNKTELLPCPFCGCETTLLTGREDIRIAGRHGKQCPLLDLDMIVDSREAWNTRAAPPEDVRAVGEEPVAIGALMRDCDERIVFESSGEVHIWDGMEVFSQPQRPKAPTIDFNEEILLPCPPGVRVGFCGDVKLSFDGAEYRGRAWLMEQGGKEEWVAIEGPENARKAGEALIAWAEAWEDKNDA